MYLISILPEILIHYNYNMMNRVIIASLLLMTSASTGADSLHSSLGDPKTVEQKERKGVNVLNRREMQELKERALVGAEVSHCSTSIYLLSL